MKKRLRENFLKKRDSIPVKERLKKSDEIWQRLSSLPEFEEAPVILFYVSFGSEVHTHKMIRSSLESKKIALPVVNGENLILSELRDWKELSTGSYGILEPREIRKVDSVDLAIVPGMAFDLNGHRIGYGKGYYDRLLNKMYAQKIGLTFECQLVDSIPSSAHDVAVDAIITENRIIRGKRI